MPLDQHIEGGHGKRQACLKIRLAPMHDLCHMADERQHGEHRLDEYAILPLPPSTEFEVSWIALGRMEGAITQDNHLCLALPNEPLQGGIRHVSRGPVPRELPSHPPSVVH